MSDGFWRTSTPSEPSFSGPPLPKKQRATTGVRQRSAAPVQPEAGSFEADDASEHGWGAVDDAWGAAEAAAAAPPAAAASGSLHERVGSIRVPAAAAEAVRRQVQFHTFLAHSHCSTKHASFMSLNLLPKSGRVCFSFMS